jgi:hypothetical protein
MCPACGHASDTFELFSDLSLEIQEVRARRLERAVSSASSRARRRERRRERVFASTSLRERRHESIVASASLRERVGSKSSKSSNLQ